jgi:hypothetical protein
MMPNCATDGCADYAMVACHMTDYASDGGAFETAVRVGNDRQRCGKSG